MDLRLVPCAECDRSVVSLNCVRSSLVEVLKTMILFKMIKRLVIAIVKNTPRKFDRMFAVPVDTSHCLSTV